MGDSEIHWQAATRRAEKPLVAIPGAAMLTVVIFYEQVQLSMPES